MDFVCILFGIAFMVAGGLFFMGKLHTRMKSCQNMPDEEKEKINIVPLYRNVGQMIFLCGTIFLTKGIVPVFSQRYFTLAMVIWLVLSGLDLCYVSKSRKFYTK